MKNRALITEELARAWVARNKLLREAGKTHDEAERLFDVKDVALRRPDLYARATILSKLSRAMEQQAALRFRRALTKAFGTRYTLTLVDDTVRVMVRPLYKRGDVVNLVFTKSTRPKPATIKQQIETFEQALRVADISHK